MVGVIRRFRRWRAERRWLKAFAQREALKQLIRMTANDRAHLIRPLAPPVRGTVWGSEDIAAGNVRLPSCARAWAT